MYLVTLAFVFQIVDEISKPLTKVNKIKMVSSSGTEVGAAKITGEVLDILNRLPETVEKLTGINISQVSGSHKPIALKTRAVNFCSCIRNPDTVQWMTV